MQNRITAAASLESPCSARSTRVRCESVKLPLNDIPPSVKGGKQAGLEILIGRSPRGKPTPVTGPVARFARQIAGQGYIVAAPSSYHDFTGPEPLAYDVPGTDKGNQWKVEKVSVLVERKLPPAAPAANRYNLVPRPSSRMTRTPARRLTTSFPSPHARAASGPRACVWAGTSRLEPA